MAPTMAAIWEQERLVPEPATAGLLVCGVVSFLGFVSFRRLIK